MSRQPDNDEPLPEGSPGAPATGGGSETGSGSEAGSGNASYLEDVTADAGESANAERATPADDASADDAPADNASGRYETAGSDAAAGYGADSDEAGMDSGAGENAEDGDGDNDAEDEESSGGIFPQDFWTHVEDLRWVLVKSVLAFAAGVLVLMVFSVRAQKLLTWPLLYGLRLSGSENTDILLRTDGPFSVFTFMLQLWVFGGLLLSLPFILYFAAGFIAPGLTAEEKKLLRPVAFSGLGLFLLGCLFAFFLLLPTYIAVSLSLENAFGFASLWTPGNYYGAVVWTTLGMGIVFEFPLVLILLQYLGLVSAQTLKQYRRHAFVFILVFAALLTPGGDPISLAVCSLPLYALFEISLVVGERVRKRPRTLES